MKQTHYSKPIAETLLDVEEATKYWPESIAQNEMFLNQIKARSDLNERLRYVTSQLPRADISLQEAIQQNLIAEFEVEKLYESLSDLLEQPEYQRLILYLPFEFLPQVTWISKSKSLQTQLERFRRIYKNAWERQLFVQDVRSNFVDGEATDEEVRRRSFRRVVKAAHLIPKLAEAGMISAEDVIYRMEKADDLVLKESLADTMPVLADLGLISIQDRRRMQQSKDWFVRQVEREIDMPVKSRKSPSKSLPTNTLEAFQTALQIELKAVEATRYEDTSPNRAKWLKSEAKRNTIETGASSIRQLILSETRGCERIIDDFLSKESISASQQAIVDGVRQAIETTFQEKPTEAQELYQSSRAALKVLWKRNIPEVQDALRKIFFRLNSLHVISDEELAELGITRPTLAGPFSENLKLMEAEIQAIQQMMELVETHPELTSYLYPVALVFGSKLKGYSSSSSDIDTGVFVRPGIDPQKRERLKQLFDAHFTFQGNPMEVKQFWLKEEADHLAIHDFQEDDLCLGESHWTHVLFGAAWVGNQETVDELRKRLLTPYFYETDKRFYSHAAHRFYLETLERDSLQFRLMHKGYDKFYAPQGGIKTAHGSLIDGESTFWDSGYRQTATRLFVNRVFLPKIPREDKGI